MDGKVPPGWRLVKFSDAADVNPRRPLKQGQRAPFVEMAALPEQSPRISYVTERVANGGGAKFQNGDTLFARITPCVENEKVGFVDCLAPGQVGFGSTEFIVLGPRDGLSHPKFLYFLSRLQTVRSTAIARMTGTSGRQRVPVSVFRDELDVLLPPLAEQRKIAEVLSSVDDAIEKTEAVIRQVQAVRRGLMQQLLTRGSPGRHTRFKHTEVGEIPEEWEVVSLGEVAEVARGKFAHRPRTEPRFYGGPYPFVQTGDVVASNGRIRSYTQTLNDVGLSISRLFPKGTILITIAANIGETALAEFDVAFPDSLVGVIPRGKVDARYLEYFLRTQKDALIKVATESAQKNINLQILRPWLVALPPMGEQVVISETLDSIGAREAAEAGRLESLRQTKSALMQALLTGETRVKVVKE